MHHHLLEAATADAADAAATGCIRPRLQQQRNSSICKLLQDPNWLISLLLLLLLLLDSLRQLVGHVILQLAQSVELQLPLHKRLGPLHLPGANPTPQVPASCLVLPPHRSILLPLLLLLLAPEPCRCCHSGAIGR
jgi:hypothetical protein